MVEQGSGQQLRAACQDAAWKIWQSCFSQLLGNGGRFQVHDENTYPWHVSVLLPGGAGGSQAGGLTEVALSAAVSRYA